MVKNKASEVKILEAVEDQVKTVDNSGTLDFIGKLDAILLGLESLEQRLAAVENKSGIGLPEQQIRKDPMVIVQSPGQTNEQQELQDMKTDRYQEIQNQRKALMDRKNSKYVKPKTGNTIDLNTKLRSLVGSHLGMVQTSLTNMKVAGTISNFQVLPIGVPAPSNSVSGRVIVTVDANSNVLDIYLG